MENSLPLLSKTEIDPAADTFESTHTSPGPWSLVPPPLVPPGPRPLHPRVPLVPLVAPVSPRTRGQEHDAGQVLHRLVAELDG